MGIKGGMKSGRKSAPCFERGSVEDLVEKKEKFSYSYTIANKDGSPNTTIRCNGASKQVNSDDPKIALLHKALSVRPQKNLDNYICNPFQYNQNELTATMKLRNTNDCIDDMVLAKKRKKAFAKLLISLKNMTNFDDDDLEDLLVMFTDMSRKSDYPLSKKEFHKSVGRLFETDRMNTFFINKIFNIFDYDNSGTVAFKDVAVGMNSALGGSNWEEQLLFYFKLFDLDNDGVISRYELTRLLQMACNQHNVIFLKSIHESNAVINASSSSEITFKELKNAVTLDPSLLILFGRTSSSYLQRHTTVHEREMSPAQMISNLTGKMWHLKQIESLSHQMKKMKRILLDPHIFSTFLQKAYEENQLDLGTKLDNCELRMIVDTIFSYTGDRPSEEEFLECSKEYDDGTYLKTDYQLYFKNAIVAGLKRIEKQRMELQVLI